MNPPQRASFSARYRHPVIGTILLLLGGLFLLGLMAESGGGVVAALVGVGLIVWSIYLLRGTGLSPKAQERARVAQEQRDRDRQTGYEQAINRLIVAKDVGRAAIFLAYREAHVYASQWYPNEEYAIVAQMLDIAQIEEQTLRSNHVGDVVTMGHPVIEVYDDWLIWGVYGYDVDATTRGTVYVDPISPDELNPSAQLSVASSSWSFSAPISHDAVHEARRIFDQLSAHIETRKQRGISHTDIWSMIEVIRNSTGQSESEKIRELSKLRYEWLLSDEEFEQARQQILGRV